jgi:hypothetical protein
VAQKSQTQAPDSLKDEKGELIEIKYDTIIENPVLQSKGYLTFGIENIIQAKYIATTDEFKKSQESYCTDSLYVPYSECMIPGVRKKIESYDPNTQFCILFKTRISPNYNAEVVIVIQRHSTVVKKALFRISAPVQTESLNGVSLREKHLENLLEELKKRNVTPSMVHGIFKEMYEIYARQNKTFSRIIGGPRDNFKMILSCTPTPKYEKPSLEE